MEIIQKDIKEIGDVLDEMRVEIMRLRVELSVTRTLLIDSVQELTRTESRAEAHAMVNRRVFNQMGKLGVQP
jgi:hypothetical protein